MEDYCKGRAAVLQRLQAGDIYFTEYWRSRLADRARRNLQWEQEVLAKGGILTPDLKPPDEELFIVADHRAVR